MMAEAEKKSQYQLQGAITEVTCQGDICKISIDAPEICQGVRAGQFVMVKVTRANSDDPLLRRPFSVHMASSTELSIVFKIVGRGTELLSRAKPGELLDVVGPLGQGFQLRKDDVQYLIGGGMGIAPMLLLAKKLTAERQDCKLVVLLGARSADELIAIEDFQALPAADVRIATDDGSKGHHGLVLDLLVQAEVENKSGAVYCCGPWPMMQAVSSFCRGKKMSCQVSLETMMACGVGACLGCAVQGADLLNGYLHVCKDGPVYEAEKVWA